VTKMNYKDWCIESSDYGTTPEAGVIIPKHNIK